MASEKSMRRQALCWLLGILIAMSLPLLEGGLASSLAANAKGADISEQRDELIRQPIIQLEEQPFFRDIETYSDSWEDSYLGKITGYTPEATLLRFYAAMARVGNIIAEVSNQADTEPGLLGAKVA